MPRVLIAEGCREVDFGGRRHYALGGEKGYAQGGLFEMSDAAAKQAVKIGGAIVPWRPGPRPGLGVPGLRVCRRGADVLAVRLGMRARMRAALIFPAAARPYPGEVPVPVHEAGTAVPDPGWRPELASVELEAGEGGCTGRKADGGVCNGRAGDDGRCARHKEG